MFSTPIVFASWLLIGPPLPIFISITILILITIAIQQLSLTRKSFALLGLMGLMMLESVVFVLIMHFQPWSSHSSIGGGVTWLSQLLFGLDFRLAEVGVVAALCIASAFSALLIRR